MNNPMASKLDSVFSTQDVFVSVDGPENKNVAQITHQRKKIFFAKKEDEIVLLNPETFSPTKVEGELELIESLIRRPDGNIVLSRTLQLIPINI